MAELGFEQKLEIAAPFIQQANAMAAGLPRLLHGIDLWDVMATTVDDETHLLTAMRAGLSGESHGDHKTDSGKYVVPNRAFYGHLDTMINAGLWTPDKSIDYPPVEEIDPDSPIGLSIPGLKNEKVTFGVDEINADSIVVAAATFDGTKVRIETVVELLDAGSRATTIVVNSGPRLTLDREGDSGRYKEFDVRGNEQPITELFPREIDSVKAIVEKTFNATLESVGRDESPEGIALRGGEVESVYKANRNGKQLTIIVRNGMPVVEMDAMNRPKGQANPRIPVTLKEYLRDYDIRQGSWSYVSSFPHRNRIAIEGIKAVLEMGRIGGIKIFPQGKMSSPDKVTAGLHMGEVLPIMLNTKELVKALGLPTSLLVSTTTAARRYIETGHI